ncbi:Ig-like domain-containing protein [Nocardioides sp.]|uniref:Ig-like domain-containing protein n=1 Tax=Nocardioides sp. TaxID=35761 RepID=UPI003D0F3544
MFQINRSESTVTTSDSAVQGAASRRMKKPALLTFAVIGGLLLAPQVLSSPGTAYAGESAASVAVPALVPPQGSTWVVGVLTDQAGHGLDNVNVEAWPQSITAAEPVASSLTYGGPAYDAQQRNGFFRLEVPSGKAYRIVISAVGAQEDGDPFRMKWYGGGRPVMMRTTTHAAAAGTGTVRDLGTIQLARQGKVASTTKVARPAKVKAGTHGKIRVTVSSRYVTNVTGKVIVNVSGKKVSTWLNLSDHGRATVRLPKLKVGKHAVSARFVGTGTVHTSKSKVVKVIVAKKR